MSTATLKNQKLRARWGDYLSDPFPAEASGTPDAGGMNWIIAIQSSADDFVYP